MYKKHILKCVVAGILAITALTGCASDNAQKEQLKKENADLNEKYNSLTENKNKDKNDNENKANNSNAVNETAVSSNGESINIKNNNVPISINGVNADIKSYNIDGKIYLRLSSIGDYMGFEPEFKNDVIKVAEKPINIGTYEYYGEFENIPKYNSVNKGASKTNLNGENLYPNADVVFTYKSNNDEFLLYKKVLKKEDFQYIGNISTKIRGLEMIYDIYQIENQYSIVLGIKDNNVVIAVGSSLSSVTKTAETPKPTQEPEENEESEE